MPRVHTQKAGKDYPDHGISKGDTYYWWKFRYGGKCKSKTYPKPSQLTQSDYLGRIYEFQEQEIEGTLEELQCLRDDLVGQLEELRDEQQEKLDNMPEGLQQGATGELLQERYDCVDGVISELESIDFEFEVDEDAEGDQAEQEDECATEKADEIRAALEGLN